MAEHIKHEPFHLRDLMPEQVYAEQWKALASRVIPADDRGDWPGIRDDGQAILAGHNRNLHIGQYEASLGASFFTWLGTSVGRCFVNLGNELSLTIPRGRGGCGAESGFIAAWALHNTRHHSRNHGWRDADFLAFDSSNWNDARYCVPPKLSEKHMEVLENAARWLGTEAGREFVLRCEILVEERMLRPKMTAAERIIIREAGEDAE